MKSTFSVLNFQNVRAFKNTHGNAARPINFRATELIAEKIDAIQCQPTKRYAETTSIANFDDYNKAIREEYVRIRNNTPDLRPSIFGMNNLFAVGQLGLLFDLDHRSCLLGDDFGWDVQFAKWYTELKFNAIWSSTLDEFAVDHDFRQDHENLDKCAFLSAPGQDIYGHWIIDLVPRIFLLRQAGFVDQTLFIGELPQWSRFFVENSGLKFDAVRIAPAGTTHLRSRVFLPGFLKVGYTIDRDFCRSAWDFFLENVRRNQGKSDENTTKIFLSRTRWPSDRIIENIFDIESAAHARGYRVVHPETLNQSDQAALFEKARIIIGQDGSALHNIIYSRPPAALGVISNSNRLNMWHASICDALGHKVAYLQTEKSDGRSETVQSASFHAFVDELEKL